MDNLQSKTVLSIFVSLPETQKLDLLRQMLLTVDPYHLDKLVQDGDRVLQDVFETIKKYKGTFKIDTGVYHRSALFGSYLTEIQITISYYHAYLEIRLLTDKERVYREDKALLARLIKEMELDPEMTKMWLDFKSLQEP